MQISSEKCTTSSKRINGSMLSAFFSSFFYSLTSKSAISCYKNSNYNCNVLNIGHRILFAFSPLPFYQNKYLYFCTQRYSSLI